MIPVRNLITRCSRVETWSSKDVSFGRRSFESWKHVENNSCHNLKKDIRGCKAQGKKLRSANLPWLEISRAAPPQFVAASEFFHFCF
jgi:hypothetical protein